MRALAPARAAPPARRERASSSSRPMRTKTTTSSSRGAVASASASASASAASTHDALAAWVMRHGGDVAGVVVRDGDRGRGLFAARDVAAGDVVMSVPLAAALNDGVAAPPYDGAPWSVTLAAAILAERRIGDASRWAPYVRSLPTDVVGFANDEGLFDDASCGASSSSSSSSSQLAAEARALASHDAAAADELDRYRSLLTRSHAALTSAGRAPAPPTFAEWRWAMSMVHSRTFRLEEPAAGVAGFETRRVMVPYVDLLNHDSRANVWQCEWDCEWDLGGGGGTFVVTATRDVRAGEEVLVSYGERCDRHFFLFFGFLPAPNPHNTVALFANAREAAAWYEALCDDGEEVRDAWARLRADAVRTVRKEEKSRAAAAAAAAAAKRNGDDASDDADVEADASDTSEEEEEEEEDDDDDDDDETPRGAWTSKDAEAEEAAALCVGEDAVVDERLTRLFELLSGCDDVAVAAVRVRAREMLTAFGGDEEEEEEDEKEEEDSAEVSEAVALARGYRARRKALLSDVA